ncbi:unnamed protein product [Rotaria sp. Silwood2]|nr:unnamed protein product [Rotaria sp. Silwood2]CAF2578204.1 unnamed protein product [Rotaria sp. Silwood2]CAF2986298.1 unnamed protein product [Rotaria sp. Silwood2]CAF3394441.1 unnamed protein product [Rotaria sp. Silwood2]CAF3994503.1 unnamed protein product [Rotaria sp. Silwood2]
MSTTTTDAVIVTLEQVHGTVMILAWIVFASAGILFARYGRRIRFGDTSKLFGADIWFQMHRSIVILAAITILVGLIIILAKGENESVQRNRDEQRVKAHSALGFIVIGCTLLQVVMGLFRCGPQSAHRFIFNWIHRTVGILAFILSIPTLFLITSVLKTYLTGLMIILSLWAGWIAIIVIVLEIIQYRSRSNSSTIGTKMENGKDGQELNDGKLERVPSGSKNMKPEPRNYNNLTLSLFILNLIVAIGLAIPLIVLIWQQ